MQNKNRSQSHPAEKKKKKKQKQDGVNALLSVSQIMIRCFKLPLLRTCPSLIRQEKVLSVLLQGQI